MSLEPEQMDLVKDLSKKGVIVGKDAGENVEPRDVKLVEDADSTPMFFTEGLRKGLRSKDNRRKAREIHSERSKRARTVDEKKDAGVTLEDPLTDKELGLWKNNKNEVDIEGVDSEGDGGLF